LVRLHQRSSTTVRDFCAEHGVSEPSFYAWKRTIAQRDQTAAPLATSEPLFIALGNLSAPTPFELVLPQDRVLRIPAGFDPHALRQLLAVLAEATPC
jgi:transposase-like protein